LPLAWKLHRGAQSQLKGNSMSRYQQRVMALLGLVLIGAAMIGCASNSSNDRDDGRTTTRAAPEAYEQDLVRARASITEAEQAGAAEFGSAQLALARDKLRAAERALADGAVERAEWLAREANLDADLAAAITRNQQTQALATEVRSGLSTLDDELRRTESSDVNRP
jgi:hypothetical protein